MAEMLIKNGMIVDGTGSAPFRGHLSLSEDRIESVVRANTPEGDALLGREYASTIDAAGFAVAPGFIDAHNHFDWVLPLPDHEFLSPMVEQGITTIVSGHKLALQGNSALASNFGGHTVLGMQPDYDELLLEKIKTVTKEDVMECAKKYLDTERYVLVRSGRLDAEQVRRLEKQQ